MRRIEIEPDLHLTFAGRGEEFDSGVEVGMVTVLMAQGVSWVARDLSFDAVEQLRPIADRLGYLIAPQVTSDQERLLVDIVRRGQRPRLRIVG